MGAKSGIEWTDATWEPVTGCTLVSDGCRNCYAAALAAGRMQHHPSMAGLARRNAAGVAAFTGEVRFNEAWLTQPLRWRKPVTIFVCSRGDLFHEAVPDAWIDRVFAVMALAPQHFFRVLTKRPERMRAYLSAARAHPVGLAALDQTFRSMQENPDSKVGDGCVLQGDIAHLKEWPLPNVGLGVSVEDQATADARIPLLLATPAAMRFVSAEPLLGAVDLRRVRRFPIAPREFFDALRGSCWTDQDELPNADPSWDWPGRPLDPPAKIDEVIAGGESGAGARPMHPDWARGLRDQCAAADVPFFFKQWGERLPVGQHLPGYGKVHGGTAVTPGRMKLHYGGAREVAPLHAFAERGVEIGALADGCLTFRVGKKAAGALLNGVEHAQVARQVTAHFERIGRAPAPNRLQRFDPPQGEGGMEEGGAG